MTGHSWPAGCSENCTVLLASQQLGRAKCRAAAPGPLRTWGLHLHSAAYHLQHSLQLRLQLSLTLQDGMFQTISVSSFQPPLQGHALECLLDCCTAVKTENGGCCPDSAGSPQRWNPLGKANLTAIGCYVCEYIMCVQVCMGGKDALSQCVLVCCSQPQIFKFHRAHRRLATGNWVMTRLSRQAAYLTKPHTDPHT